MRNIKKIVPRIFLLIAFVVLLEALVRFLYEPYDRYSIYANREYEQAMGSLDTIYLGTSQAYYGFDPALFDAELGTNSFNMGTGSQSMFVAWQLLQEAVENNPIENVFLGISFSSLMKEETDDSVLAGYDRMVTLKGKLRFILSDQNGNRRINELFYSTRVENYLNIKRVQKNIKKKLSADYAVMKPTASDNEYSCRGYRTTDKVFDGERKNEENTYYHKWNEEELNEENVSYFKKILELCQEKGISVSLVILPVTGVFLEDAGDVEGMHTYFAEMAETYDAALYDYINIENREELFPDTCFRDSYHMNTTGAQVFGNLLISELKKEQ
ncbi:MAG: hypothetical protein Q4F41_20855 [Eubacteriales bacterium]|nr:hypothetical protein [Eubacteriales bacterium]